MSRADGKEGTRDLLVNYMLGRSSPEAAARLEERFFEEDALFDELMMVRAELAEDYLDGSLAGQDRELFEGRFLRIPGWRREVEFTRDLLALVNRRSTAEPDASSGASLIPFLARRSRRFLEGALAAAALLLALLSGGVWLGVSSLQSRLARLQQESASGTIQTTLTPWFRFRSENSSELPLLTISSETRWIDLTMQVDGEGATTGFRAELGIADGGRNLLALSGLVAAPSPAGRSIRIVFPASILDRGEYVITLHAPTDAGSGAEIAQYRFRVVGP